MQIFQFFFFLLQLNEIGFKKPLASTANINHYGCPFPKPILQQFQHENQNFDRLFQENFAQTLVESLILKSVTTLNAKNLKRDEKFEVMADERVMKFVQDFVRQNGEAENVEQFAEFVDSKVKEVISA